MCLVTLSFLRHLRKNDLFLPSPFPRFAILDLKSVFLEKYQFQYIEHTLLNIQSSNMFSVISNDINLQQLKIFIIGMYLFILVIFSALNKDQEEKWSTLG